RSITRDRGADVVFAFRALTEDERIVGRQLMKRPALKELSQVAHVIGTGTVEGGLPVRQRRDRSGVPERPHLPDGVVAVSIAGGPRQNVPVAVDPDIIVGEKS